MHKDFYSILGISCNATDLEIKKAFRLKAVKYHPDKNFGSNSFAKKFIEIKKAYDTLIHPGKRIHYDAEYTLYQKNAQDDIKNARKDERKESEQRGEKFRRNSYKSFYSDGDRKQQETPQVKPKQTPWGLEINDYFEFFAFPKSIGRLIGGVSTIPIGAEKISLDRLIINVLTYSGTLLVLLAWASFFFLLRQHWYYNLNREDATQIMISAFVVMSLITLAFRVANRYNAVAFEGLNYFIGVNGFAIYKCKESIENIAFGQEVNFNNVTDLIVRRGKTGQLKEKNYQFVWCNSSSQDVVFEGIGKYDNFAEDMVRLGYPEYWMNVEAEKYWTIYLLDRMEENLEKTGHLVFSTFDWNSLRFQPYLHLGIGFISFIQGDEIVTYKYENIKRIYTKGNELYIEKDNYEKALFIFKSGNKNCIPLDSLCNKLFFIRATEILLGYSIEE